MGRLSFGRYYERYIGINKFHELRHSGRNTCEIRNQLTNLGCSNLAGAEAGAFFTGFIMEANKGTYAMTP